MIIDFRYHVASLVAIFIALGLGIFIGSALVGEDIIENIAQEQKIWIGKLENDYLKIKQETENLKSEMEKKQDELTYYKNFAKEIQPYLVEDSLLKKNIALIQIGKNKKADNVVQLLSNSGANIQSTTIFNLEKETALMGSLDFITQFYELLAIGKKGQYIKYLEEKEYLKNQGVFGKDLDAIIIYNTSFSLETYNNLIIPLVNNADTSSPLYFVEETNNHNYIEMLRKADNVCSIDCFDTVPGQIALILALEGAKGHYGVKANADSIIPVFRNKEYANE